MRMDKVLFKMIHLKYDLLLLLVTLLFSWLYVPFSPTSAAYQPVISHGGD